MLFAAISGIVSCKSSKSATTENNYSNQTMLTEKHWKLAELNGHPVSETAYEPFIVFEKEENRVHGNTSCNSFFGTVDLQGENKIKFSQVGTTRKACIGNDIETPFIHALESAAEYKIENGSLALSDKSGTILARFIEKSPN